MRAVLGWREGRWLKSDQTRRGWLVQTEHGLLGPADLLAPDTKTAQDAPVLEVAGKPVPMSGEAVQFGEGLVRRNLTIGETQWPDELMRAADLPEDCVVIGDRAVPPLPLTAARLTPGKSSWAVDPAVPIDVSWHGACVLGRRDGCLIGLLLVDDDGAKVALLPPPDPPKP